MSNATDRKRERDGKGQSHGLRTLTCWSHRPTEHAPHTFTVRQEERFWCPGYPSDPRHSAS